METQAQNSSEKQYHVYKSSMRSHKTLTPAGKIVTVMEYQVITDDKEVIDFLENEIKVGSPYFTRAGIKTAEDMDPMARLKKQIIAEHEAKRAAGEDPTTAQLPDTITSPVDNGVTSTNELKTNHPANKATQVENSTTGVKSSLLARVKANQANQAK